MMNVWMPSFPILLARRNHPPPSLNFPSLFKFVLPSLLQCVFGSFDRSSVPVFREQIEVAIHELFFLLY